MQEDFNIQEYLARSVENIVKDSIKATLKNPKEALFLAGFAKSTRKATKTREEYLKQDFFPHEMSNGTIIMISDDRRYYY